MPKASLTLGFQDLPTSVPPGVLESVASEQNLLDKEARASPGLRMIHKHPMIWEVTDTNGSSDDMPNPLPRTLYQ